MGNWLAGRGAGSKPHSGWVGSSRGRSFANSRRRLFLYRQSGPGAIARVWRIVHPYDTLVAAEYPSRGQGIYPDRIRYEDVPEGKIAHLLKRW